MNTYPGESLLSESSSACKFKNHTYPQPNNLVSGMNSPRSAGFSAGEETSLRRQRNPPEMATDRWQGSHGTDYT
eukprot:853721-Amorphochlora_amoeboformis.AAC.1